MPVTDIAFDWSKTNGGKADLLSTLDAFVEWVRLSPRLRAETHSGVHARPHITVFVPMHPLERREIQRKLLPLGCTVIARRS